jgi:uncharacterized protein (DUF433 family)
MFLALTAHQDCDGIYFVRYQLAIDQLESYLEDYMMRQFARITMDPAVMGGKACVRGLRVTVGTVVGLIAAGRSRAEVLSAYPYLEPSETDVNCCAVEMPAPSPALRAPSPRWGEGARTTL